MNSCSWNAIWKSRICKATPPPTQKITQNGIKIGKKREMCKSWAAFCSPPKGLHCWGVRECCFQCLFTSHPQGHTQWCSNTFVALFKCFWDVKNDEEIIFRRTPNMPFRLNSSCRSSKIRKIQLKYKVRGKKKEENRKEEEGKSSLWSEFQDFSRST